MIWSDDDDDDDDDNHRALGVGAGETATTEGGGGETWKEVKLKTLNNNLIFLALILR